MNAAIPQAAPLYAAPLAILFIGLSVRTLRLRRKARGLAQSGDREARAFGQLVLATLEGLMAAVYAAREGPPPGDLPTQHAPALAALRTACERCQGSHHRKTHALAVELLNDWEAIVQVLSHPELPLTRAECRAKTGTNPPTSRLQSEYNCC